MNNKYVVYIAGIIIILSGVGTILNPEPGTVELFGIKRGPKGTDVTPIKWPLGLIIIGTGLLLLYSEYKKRNKKMIYYSVCPKCKEPYLYYELKNGICPRCDIKTIDMDVYYEKK